METRGDKAILLGSVRSWAEHEEAEEVARATPGAFEVENRIMLAGRDPPMEPNPNELYDDNYNYPATMTGSGGGGLHIGGETVGSYLRRG